MTLLKPRAPRSNDGVAIARSLRAPEAFAEVFDRHFVTIYRYVARRTGRENADDLVAQTFTLAFAHRGRYRDELGTARPWLMGIATNLIRAEHRDEVRRARTVERLGAEAWTRGGGSSSDPAPDCDHDYDLAAALGRLDPDQRDALLLHAWGALSYA
ncbi:MAG: RNA polymerase sigma factor, partial [Solirubrobacteraceae bacterium]